MENNDFNIKPVENLQNIKSLNTVKRDRKEKHKQNQNEEEKKTNSKQSQLIEEPDINNEIQQNDEDSGKIDFHA